MNFFLEVRNCSKHRQGRGNRFQSREGMEHWNGISATMVGSQEKFLNSNALEWLKHFNLPYLNSFCFETLSFFLFFPYFPFATKKKRGGAMTPPQPAPRFRCPGRPNLPNPIFFPVTPWNLRNFSSNWF